MTREGIAELLLRYEATIPSHNPAAQAALYTPDAVRESPASGPVTGRMAIEKHYSYWFGAFPDLSLDLEEMLIDGDEAAAFWKARGRQEGPFFGLSGEGSRVDIPMASIFKMGDGGIAYARYFYDFSSVLLKTGALKVKPSP